MKSWLKKFWLWYYQNWLFDCISKTKRWNILIQYILNPAGNYMFKVHNRNIRTRCEICSKLTISITIVLIKVFHSWTFLYATCKNVLLKKKVKKKRQLSCGQPKSEKSPWKVFDKRTKSRFSFFICKMTDVSLMKKTSFCLFFRKLVGSCFWNKFGQLA